MTALLDRPDSEPGHQDSLATRPPLLYYTTTAPGHQRPLPPGHVAIVQVSPLQAPDSVPELLHSRGRSVPPNVPTRVLSLLLAMTADSWLLEAALGLGLGWGETWRGTDVTGASCWGHLVPGTLLRGRNHIAACGLLREGTLTPGDR